MMFRALSSRPDCVRVTQYLLPLWLTLVHCFPGNLGSIRSDQAVVGSLWGPIAGCPLYVSTYREIILIRETTYHM